MNKLFIKINPVITEMYMAMPLVSAVFVFVKCLGITYYILIFKI